MANRLLYAASPDWAAYTEEIARSLNGPECRIVKKTTRTLAVIAQLDGAEVFIKRVINDSWLKGLIARVFGSRARKTIRGAQILRRGGFSCPRLIAAFEERYGGSVQASYVVTEYLRRPKVLSRFVLADGRDFHWRRDVSEQVARTIRELHAAGCYTRDLQETNLMLETASGGFQIYFTDLEDFRWLPFVPLRLRLNNLLQLDRSIGRFISRSHRLRFLHNYFGHDSGDAKSRAAVARLLRINELIEQRKLRRLHTKAILTPATGGSQNVK